MSFGTMYVSNSGLRAQQLGIDVVANNIANANTSGYKTSRVHFQETLVRNLTPARQEEGGQGSVNAKQVGLGTSTAAISRNFSQGGFLQTGIETDVGIEGEGFLVVQGYGEQPDLLYTRDGSFHVDSQTTGDTIRFANADGNLLMGVNAVVSAATGLMSIPSTGLGLAPEVIEVDVASGLPGFATSTVEFQKNLFALQPLAYDPVRLETETLGVDNSFRLEFRRAAGGTRDLFFFRATETDQTMPAGTYASLTDTGGGAIDGEEIEGIVEFGSDGQVVGWYSAAADADGDDFLTPAETAGLAAWPEFSTTSIAGEAHGTADGTSVPGAFALTQAPVVGASVVVRSGAAPLALGTDYTLDASTGLVTPRTAWPAGAVTVDYDYETPFFTVGQAAFAVAAEAHGAADGAAVPPAFAVTNAPIQAASLTVNATIGAAAVAEGTDYAVDYTNGVVTPLTVWDAAAITVSYTRADTRERIDFDSRSGDPNTIVFRSTTSLQSAVAARRADADVVVGTAVEVYDSRSDAHSLGVRFERLSTNEWLYEVTPTIRETLDSSVVVDTAFDGGASAATVVLGAAGALAAEPLQDGKYRITVEIDEGGGFYEFTQVAASAPFVSTGAGTREFKVIGAATSAPSIAFSRDLTTSHPSFSIRVTRTLAEPTGVGRLEFDSSGELTSAPVVQAASVRLTLAASPLSPNLDFTDLMQAGAENSVTATQDGFPEGDFLSFEFDEGGRIMGLYSNSKTQALGRVLLARFPNEGGLEAQGANLFLAGNNAGSASYAYAGETGNGTIRPRSIEASNVDLSVELVDLILFQRVYQFNSRVVTTVDSMIHEAIQMKR